MKVGMAIALLVLGGMAGCAHIEPCPGPHCLGTSRWPSSPPPPQPSGYDPGPLWTPSVPGGR